MILSDQGALTLLAMKPVLRVPLPIRFVDSVRVLRERWDYWNEIPTRTESERAMRDARLRAAAHAESRSRERLRALDNEP